MCVVGQLLPARAWKSPRDVGGFQGHKGLA
jgi:hypothetical protein